MARKPAIEFGNAILCEDIREEVNRKHSLIGVFSGNILVPHFPALIRLAIYIEATIHRKGAHIIKLKIQLNDKVALEAPMSVPPEQMGQTVIVVPNFIFNVPGEGQIALSVSLEESASSVTISKYVSVGQIPSLALAATPPP